MLTISMSQNTNHKYCEQRCQFSSKIFVWLCSFCLIAEKYHGTSAWDNIGIGNTKMNTYQEIKKASTLSHAHNIIDRFSSSYQTRLRTSPYVDFFSPSHSTLKSPDDVPFMTKMLSNRLHCGAKARGKPLTWDTKPKIDITIPKHKAGSNYEVIESHILSGGEWQRVALARSFMNISEADLLILDEPSSALDPGAEHDVFKTLKQYRKNRTTIFIVCEFQLSLLILRLIAFTQFAQRQRSWCWI
jgi:hypothetical protein